MKFKVKGLNFTTIAYFQRNFRYCIKQNKDDAKCLQEGLSAIVPNAKNAKNGASIRKTPRISVTANFQGEETLR